MDHVNFSLLVHKVGLHLPKDYLILIGTHGSLVCRSQTLSVQSLMAFSMQHGAYIKSDKTLRGKSMAAKDYGSVESLNLCKTCKLSFCTHN